MGLIMLFPQWQIQRRPRKAPLLPLICGWQPCLLHQLHTGELMVWGEQGAHAWIRQAVPGPGCVAGLRLTEKCFTNTTFSTFFWISLSESQIRFSVKMQTIYLLIYYLFLPGLFAFYTLALSPAVFKYIYMYIYICIYQFTQVLCAPSHPCKEYTDARSAEKPIWQPYSVSTIWGNTMRSSSVSAASHSVSPATSSQGPVGIIWSVIAAHKWATPHEWKCSKASAAMITLCSQVIALAPLPLSSPCSHALPVEWEDKSSAGEAQGLWRKKRGGVI